MTTQGKFSDLTICIATEVLPEPEEPAIPIMLRSAHGGEYRALVVEEKRGRDDSIVLVPNFTTLTAVAYSEAHWRTTEVFQNSSSFKMFLIRDRHAYMYTRSGIVWSRDSPLHLRFLASLIEMLIKKNPFVLLFILFCAISFAFSLFFFFFFLPPCWTG